MPNSTGATGRGIPFQIGDGTTPTEGFVTVANLKTISLSGEEGSEVDFTTLLTEGGYRDFRQGFKDPGQITIGVHLDPAQPTISGARGVRALFDSGEIFNWKIPLDVFDADITGRGWVRGAGDLEINENDPMMLTVTIRRQGPTAITERP